MGMLGHAERQLGAQFYRRQPSWKYVEVCLIIVPHKFCNLRKETPLFENRKRLCSPH